MAERERPALKCPECKQPWWIGRHQFGGIAVRPGNWWQVTTEYWEATCGCQEPLSGEPKAVKAASPSGNCTRPSE